MGTYFEEAHVANIICPVVGVEGEVVDFDGLHAPIRAADLLDIGVYRHLVQLILCMPSRISLQLLLCMHGQQGVDEMPNVLSASQGFVPPLSDRQHNAQTPGRDPSHVERHQKPMIITRQQRCGQS